MPPAFTRSRENEQRCRSRGTLARAVAGGLVPGDARARERDLLGLRTWHRAGGSGPPCTDIPRAFGDDGGMDGSAFARRHAGARARRLDGGTRQPMQAVIARSTRA